MVADQRVTTLVVSCRGNIPTAQVLIQIRVLHEIPSGTLQRFVVRAPGELLSHLSTETDSYSLGGLESHHLTENGFFQPISTMGLWASYATNDQISLYHILSL